MIAVYTPFRLFNAFSTLAWQWPQVIPVTRSLTFAMIFPLPL